MTTMAKDNQYFILSFAIIFSLLFFLQNLAIVQNTVMIPWTLFLAELSFHLVSLFDENVFIYQNILKDKISGFSVSIDQSCSGIDESLVLITAILAYPANYKNKILGVIACFIIIQLLNVTRIITLFYLGQFSEELFDIGHSYIWRIVVLLGIFFLFYIWLRLAE